MSKIRILLVEDDGDDIELLKEAFEMNSINCQIDVVTEGDGVLPFLQESHALPDVIVMDLNLPRLHGREIMGLLKKSGQFSNIPLVVLTTSSSQDDINFSYASGVDRYITKPNSIEGFNRTVLDIAGLAARRP